MEKKFREKKFSCFYSKKIKLIDEALFFFWDPRKKIAGKRNTTEIKCAMQFAIQKAISSARFYEYLKYVFYNTQSSSSSVMQKTKLENSVLSSWGNSIQKFFIGL